MKQHTMKVRISQDLFEKAQLRCAKKKVSVSEWVRSLMEEALGGSTEEKSEEEKSDPEPLVREPSVTFRKVRPGEEGYGRYADQALACLWRLRFYAACDWFDEPLPVVPDTEDIRSAVETGDWKWVAELLDGESKTIIDGWKAAKPVQWHPKAMAGKKGKK